MNIGKHEYEEAIIRIFNHIHEGKSIEKDQAIISKSEDVTDKKVYIGYDACGNMIVSVLDKDTVIIGSDTIL